MKLLKLQILCILHESKVILKMYDQILFKSVSIASLVGAWAIQQVSDIEPIVSQGFDQLFSIGLLVVAVIVIWKAFSKKDESETKLLTEQVKMYKEYYSVQEDRIKLQKEQITELTSQIHKANDNIERLMKFINGRDCDCFEGRK